MNLLTAKFSILMLLITSMGHCSTGLVQIGEASFYVEVVNTKEESAKGLADYTSLAPQSGMLFVYINQNRKPTFWMKGMSFPIDIIWIKGDKIVQIDSNLKPQPPFRLYAPYTAVDYVLEVNAGDAYRYGIHVGQSVEITLNPEE